MRSKSNSAHSDFDRIAPVAGLVDDARGDIVWITLDVHAARRRSAKVGMVDERVVAKAEIGGDRFHEQGEILERCRRPGRADEAVLHGRARCQPRRLSLHRHASHLKHGIRRVRNRHVPGMSIKLPHHPGCPR